MSTPTKPSIVFCPRDLGRRLVLQQAAPAAAGGGIRGDLPRSTAWTPTRPTSPRRSAPSTGSTARPSWSATPTAAPSSPPRAPMTGWPGWSTSTPWALMRPRPPRAEQDKFPETPVVRPDRGRRRAGVDAAVGHRLLLRRPARGRAEARLGDRTSPRPPTCSCSNAPASRGGPSRAGTSWQQRPDRPPGPRAGRGQADGRHHLRHRQQPRPHAVPPRLRPRRHPRRRTQASEPAPLSEPLLLDRASRAQKERPHEGRNRWHPNKCSTYPCAATC